MNLWIIMDDDGPATNGIHLYPEQRAKLFESWWDSLTRERQIELVQEEENNSAPKPPTTGLRLVK